MGKTKKGKQKPANQNPLGIPSIKDLERLEDEFSLDGHPQGPCVAIQEQLESTNFDEKMNGLQLLAIHSANSDKVKAICETEIVRIVAPFLVDSNQALRNASAGALRNISVCGVDVCDTLVDQDVLTPLLTLLKEYANDTTWTPVIDASLNNQLDLKSDTFVQAINILWNLCESTPAALETFNQTTILHSFIRCLDVHVFGLEISISVAQCLLIISEENSNTWNILSEALPQLRALLVIEGGHSHTFLRTLAAGIISNVPALAAASGPEILVALSKTLDVNHRQILGEITSELPVLNASEELDVIQDNNAMEEETEESASLRRKKLELPSEIEQRVKQIAFLLDAQKIAAEVITNQCSTEDEEWSDDDENDMSDDESVKDYDTSSAHNNSLQNVDKLPVEIIEAIKSLGLVDKLYQRSQPIADNVQQILRESSCMLWKKIKTLRVSTLLCLQNLCNSMNTDDLGGPSSFYGVWLDLGQQVFQGPQDPMILEPATSLMRAALEHIKNSKELFQEMTESDLELMLKGVKNCSMPEIRANWLRMLCIVGCLMQEELVQKIIAFVVEACANEQDVWTLSEAIDALMDMFSDNDWKQVVFDLQLIGKCKALEAVFKSKLRQQKRELNNRYPAVMTVRSNFARFIKYLEDELSTFTPRTV